MLKNFALTAASLLVLLAALELCFRLFPDSEIQTNNEYAYRTLIDLDKQRFAPVYAEISRQFRQRGIAMIDLTGTVAGHKNSELWILSVDQHPNAVANALFAQRLTQRFNQLGFLPNQKGQGSTGQNAGQRGPMLRQAPPDGW